MYYSYFRHEEQLQCKILSYRLYAERYECIDASNCRVYIHQERHRKPQVIVP
jgi:hypothetical protein